MPSVDGTGGVAPALGSKHLVSPDQDGPFGRTVKRKRERVRTFWWVSPPVWPLFSCGVVSKVGLG